MEDRVARHIIEQHPSKTTTRLVAGLMAGTSERAVSANRCVQTLSHIIMHPIHHFDEGVVTFTPTPHSES